MSKAARPASSEGATATTKRLTVGFLAIGALVLTLTGCAISTTYGRRPLPVSARPDTYQIKIYKNAFATNDGADRTADAEIRKLLAETGCNDYKIVHVERVNRVKNIDTYTVRVFKTDNPSSLSLPDRIDVQEEARTDTAISALQGYGPVVQQLLLAREDPSKPVPSGFTALHQLLCRNYTTAEVSSLIAAGAAVNAVATNGITPLHLAALGGDPDCAEATRGVSSEWPLVKAAIIAGSAFPVAAAVGDFYEATARLIE